MSRSFLLIISVLAIISGCNSKKTTGDRSVSSGPASLRVEHNESAGTISVYYKGGDEPIVTQHAKPDFRPYVHPIVAPDGKGVLTEYSPGHHKHQTGLYWGFTRVNGRDYFHNPTGDFWKRVSADVKQATTTNALAGFC